MQDLKLDKTRKNVLVQDPDQANAMPATQGYTMEVVDNHGEAAQTLAPGEVYCYNGNVTGPPPTGQTTLNVVYTNEISDGKMVALTTDTL